MNWIVVLMLFGGLLFLENGDRIKRDTLSRDSYRVEDKRGFFKGMIKPDPLQPDRVRVEDEFGRLQGIIKRDTLSPETFEFKGD